MAYIYRFIDQDNNIIYVGKTSQALDKRIGQHFTKGHLPKECYKSIARIEYQKYKTEADSLVPAKESGTVDKQRADEDTETGGDGGPFEPGALLGRGLAWSGFDDVPILYQAQGM